MIFNSIERNNRIYKISKFKLIKENISIKFEEIKK